MAIVMLSVIGIALEEIKHGFIPINPTIIRVMRVMRIARGQCTTWSVLMRYVAVRYGALRCRKAEMSPVPGDG